MQKNKMKKIFLYSLGLGLLVASCKEQVPTGVILTQPFATKDTTYVTATVPAAQQKNVLVEEFTGVACVNCPTGAVQIKQLQKANPGRVVVIKVHDKLLANPVETGDPDFRCVDANSIASSLGMLFKPSCGVDRLYNNISTPYVFDMSVVNGKVATQLAKPTNINIDIAKKWNATLDTMQLANTFTFLNSTVDSFSYHISIVENDLEAAQDSLDKIVLTNYIHDEVLRSSITPVYVGTPMPTDAKVAGRVYTYSIKIPKPAKVINYSNCAAMVYITSRTTLEVVQVQMVEF